MSYELQGLGLSTSGASECTTGTQSWCGQTLVNANGSAGMNDIYDCCYDITNQCKSEVGQQLGIDPNNVPFASLDTFNQYMDQCRAYKASRPTDGSFPAYTAGQKDIGTPGKGSWSQWTQNPTGLLTPAPVQLQPSTVAIPQGFPGGSSNLLAFMQGGNSSVISELPPSGGGSGTGGGGGGQAPGTSSGIPWWVVIGGVALAAYAYQASGAGASMSLSMTPNRRKRRKGKRSRKARR
jgi:hypothetical protein